MSCWPRPVRLKPLASRRTVHFAMTIGNQTVAFEQRLREKWREIPATRRHRMFSSDLLTIADDLLLECWERARAETCTPAVRG